jgi:hypothetical protein
MPAAVTVIGLGCELDRLFAGQPPALPIPDPPSREELRDLLDAVAGALRRDDAVIVVVGGWLPEDTLRRVRTVHSLLDTDRVAIHVTELPPLATSVVAALAAALAPLAVSAGALAGSLDAIARELYVLAWTGSVARLQHPRVSLIHHARSLVPGSAFGVGLQPEQFVVPVGRVVSEPPLAVCEHELELLVAATHKGDLAWIVDGVAPALGGVPVRQLPPTIHGEKWWGSARLAEVVGVPASLEWLERAVLPRAVTPCIWCGEPIASSPCPLCGQALAPDPVRGRPNWGPAASIATAGGLNYKQEAE